MTVAIKTTEASGRERVREKEWKLVRVQNFRLSLQTVWQLSVLSQVSCIIYPMLGTIFSLTTTNLEEKHLWSKGFWLFHYYRYYLHPPWLITSSMAPITPPRPLTTITLSPRRGMSSETVTIIITEDTTEVIPEVSINLQITRVGQMVYSLHEIYWKYIIW